MNEPKPDRQQTLEILQKAVAKALDRKRRLGQYAVVWDGSKPVFIGGTPEEEQARINGKIRSHFPACNHR